MSTYISSNANRFYVGLESSYGKAQSVGSAQRFPAKWVRAQQKTQIGHRFDKTGTRTYLGSSPEGRRHTAFEVQTYLTSWEGSTPSYGSLFQAALGSAPRQGADAVISGVQGTAQFQTASAHGLSMGCGIAYGNEVRFVTAVPDAQTITINAPFANTPQVGNTLAACTTYAPGTTLSSLSLYDYWDPITTVSRLLVGATVDEMKLKINGDFHEFSFSGPAADLLDSTNFRTGSSGLTAFPAEPAVLANQYAVVPGHLGEIWLGGPANQFFTLTGASIEMRNNISLRNNEFGSSLPLGFSAGQRELSTSFTLMAQDDAQTLALYSAANERVPVPMMLQLGQRPGQMMAVFMQNVVPEIPIYDDSNPRLEWDFNNNLAQGVSDDEIFIAFA
jgi:hypothetical protein